MTEETPQSPTTVDEPGHADAEREERGERNELAARLARAEDLHRRALADLDNLRKRTAGEVERRVQASRESQLREWLEALDSVERALAMTPEGPVQAGLRSVLEQMDAILVRNDVRRVGEPGERFDPERHEAVAVRESEEVPDRTVVDVARSGFAVGDHVLRPAQVVVSRRPEPEA
ncbi:MAG TPA: nucleotide exchange factor GrpE [Gaiellales bacterium]|nr:nucleotide exchange factor GrpE [Gaiellales bacterium]